MSQAVYGSPIVDKDLVVFEALLDGGDITIIQGKDRKYAIISEENFPAMVGPDAAQQEPTPEPAYDGDINSAYVTTWEALNWVRFYANGLPDRLRNSERQFKAGGAIDVDLINEIRDELTERLSDVICKFADLSQAAASVGNTKIKGRKEAA